MLLTSKKETIKNSIGLGLTSKQISKFINSLLMVIKIQKEQIKKEKIS